MSLNSPKTTTTIFLQIWIRNISNPFRKAPKKSYTWSLEIAISSEIAYGNYWKCLLETPTPTPATTTIILMRTLRISLFMISRLHEISTNPPPPQAVIP